MEMLLALLHTFGGIVWLLMGGDILVRGALALASRVRVSPLVVGVTVVALGTSAPELVVSLRAALVGYPELAIANVVGSNVANVLLVVGLPAIVYPVVSNHEGAAADARIMFLASLLFVLLCATGPLGRIDGVILLVGLGLFMVHVVAASDLKEAWQSERETMEWVLGLPSSLPLIGVFLGLGALSLPLGAELLIRGAVGMAEGVGLPTSVIGLTVLALGTSLPELTTTLIAAFKQESALAVGNVIGSNILNLLAIMGVTSVVTSEGIPVPEGFLALHLPVMLASALWITWITIRGRTVDRRLGSALLGGYVLYVAVLF